MSRLESRMSVLYSKTLEPIVFPTNDKDSAIYTNQVLRALERWFKCNGWPTGHNLVKIPESFRGGVRRKPLDDNMDNMPQQDAIKCETKTIYEMLQYLSGRQLPALPQNNATNQDLNERTKQFYWQHNLLLKFLEYGFNSISNNFFYIKFI